MKSGKATVLLGAAACLLLAAGLVRLLLLRFEAGDIYPPYSSLRADPLGAKAFYDSLGKCGVSVQRNFLPPDRLTPKPDSAILFLGRSSVWEARELILEPHEGIALREFARKGGRVVVALMPRTEVAPVFGFRTNDTEEAEVQDEDTPSGDEPRTNALNRGKGKAGEAEAGEDRKKERPLPSRPGSRKRPAGEDKEEKALREAFKKWLGVTAEPVELRGNDIASLSTNLAATELPRTIPCHTVMCFSGLDPGWQTIYQRRNRPVVVERKFGNGTIVLSSVAYFVSNEALRDDRFPSLLLWLTGGKPSVIFDEFHHGISAEPNVASLIRQYRLHWFIAGLVLLACLYIWKNGTSLVPPHGETPPGEDNRYSEGRDSLSGLVNLLGRNISSSSVLSECLQKWKQNLGPAGRKAAAARIAKAEAVALAKGSREPVEAYNEISRIASTPENR